MSFQILSQVILHLPKSLLFLECRPVLVWDHLELFDLVPWCLLHDRPRVCSNQEVLLEVAVNVMAEHKWSCQIQRQHARSRYPLSSMWSIPCRCSLTDSAVSAERHMPLGQVFLPRQGLHRHPPLLDVDCDASCDLSHHSWGPSRQLGARHLMLGLQEGLGRAPILGNHELHVQCQ